MTVNRVDDVEISSSRIDPGKGSCVGLTTELDAAFLITDDLQTLPELQVLVDARVAIEPIVLRALVKRDALEPAEAKERRSRLAESRDWLGAPIYQRAPALFDDG